MKRACFCGGFIYIPVIGFILGLLYKLYRKIDIEKELEYRYKLGEIIEKEDKKA